MVRKKYRMHTGRLIFTALFSLFATIGVIAAINLAAIHSSYAASQKEYTELRQYAPPGTVETVASSPSPGETSAVVSVPPVEPEPAPDISAINPDYVGWIRIEGTEIDYPVVQCSENRTYLSTTFMGEKNASGTIFMDSRCKDGFGGCAILYGHNMKDGSMFAEMNRYREDGYLEEHPEISIITPSGDLLTYRIFDVKVTDVRDAAYKLPGKEQDAFAEYFAAQGIQGDASILVLSTCTKSNDDNERLLIFAERR